MSDKDEALKERHWIQLAADRVSQGESIEDVLLDFGYKREVSIEYKLNHVLTFDQVREVLAYNPETGELTHNQSRSGVTKGRRAGYFNFRGYIEVHLFGRLYRGHRIAWLLHYGEWPTAEIDHINGLKSDNRIKNLRCVPGLANTHNMTRARRDNTSGFAGVRKNGSGWSSSIRVEGKRFHLGTFKTAEEASAAYLDAKSSFHIGASDAAIASLRKTLGKA